MTDHVGIEVTPSWWDFVRQVVLFVTGLVILIYAVALKGANLPLLIVALILLGIVPVDRWLSSIAVRVKNGGT